MGKVSAVVFTLVNGTSVCRRESVKTLLRKKNKNKGQKYSDVHLVVVFEKFGFSV